MTAVAPHPFLAPRRLVLERFERTQPFAFSEKQECRGLVLDVETSGLSPDTDRIIQIAMLPFSFTKTGDITGVGRELVRLEDPGAPLPPEIVRLTGLTDNDLSGCQFSNEEIASWVRGADLIVCHNSEFDRAFLEKRFPFFTDYRFGCSMADCPWKEEGYTSTKLEWLLFKHCGMFTDEAHDAGIDCHIALHLLGTTLPSGKRALACVLDAARTKWVRLFALNSPFETKDLLKSRGYKWSDGSNGKPKAWYRDVAESEASDEEQWLRDNMRCAPFGVSFDSRTRFSNRIGRKQ